MKADGLEVFDFTSNLGEGQKLLDWVANQKIEAKILAEVSMKAEDLETIAKNATKAFNPKPSLFARIEPRKMDGLEAIEITTNIGGKEKTVRLDGKSKKTAAKILAEEAMSNKLIDVSYVEPKTYTGTAKPLAEDAMKTMDPSKTHIFEPKAGTASTADQLQPQLITCPYCESQEVEVLSNETITSQLCLFEMGAARTETKIKHQDTFICSGCSAIAKLSWRQAKEEK